MLPHRMEVVDLMFMSSVKSKKCAMLMIFRDLHFEVNSLYQNGLFRDGSTAKTI